MSKYQDIINQVLEVIELGENGEQSLGQLLENLSHPFSAVRFRTAYAIGNIGIDEYQVSDQLRTLLKDDSPSVRIAAARALCFLGLPEDGIQTLRNELKTSINHAVRHYAALFFEDIGDMAEPYFSDFKQAEKDQYESVRLVAQRLVAKFENV